METSTPHGILAEEEGGPEKETETAAARGLMAMTAPLASGAQGRTRRHSGGRRGVTPGSLMVSGAVFDREVAEKLKAKNEILALEDRIALLECKLTQATKKYGRNNTSKKSWNTGDVTNMVCLNSWLRMKLFRTYKFLPPTWSAYSPEKPRTMCAMVLEKVRLPATIGQENYWESRLVPLINKKYVEMRSNINSACRVAYQGR